MGAAATEIVGERNPDLGFARVLGLRQEGGRLHDHAVDAVAALCGLLVDEGLLHAMHLLALGQAFERDDLLFRADRAERDLARAHGLAVDMHRAGAALAETAAETRAVQAEI